MAEFIKNLVSSVNFNVIPSDSVPGTRVDLVLKLVTNGITILFVFVIVIAIVYTFLAGLRYITSMGKEEKVKQAGEALKAVLFGILAMFVGVIAIVFIVDTFTNGLQQSSIRKTLCEFLEPKQVTACVAAHT